MQRAMKCFSDANGIHSGFHKAVQYELGITLAEQRSKACGAIDDDFPMNFAFSIDLRNHKRVDGLCPKAADLSCQTDCENQKAVHGTKAYGWVRMRTVAVINYCACSALSMVPKSSWLSQGLAKHFAKFADVMELMTSESA